MPKPTPITWATARVEMLPDGGWRFTMPVPERTNAIWRHWKGRTLVSARHRADKATAPRLWRFVAPFAGEVSVRMVWYRARKAGDVDGRIKAALDLLRGIAYGDDAQVAALAIERVDDATEPARLVVDVRALTRKAA